MATPIPIWQTIREAILTVCRHLPMFAKGLALPLILCMGVNMTLILHQASQPTQLELMINVLTPLLNLAIAIWVLNISARITLMGMPGHLFWTMRETWSFLWTMLFLIITLPLSAGASGIAYYSLTWLPIPAGFGIAGIIFMGLIYYLAARFLPLLPSIAIGEKISLGDTWKLTKDNGWRLVVLFNIIPLISIAVIIPLLIFTGTLMGIALPVNTVVNATASAAAIVAPPVAVTTTPAGLFPMVGMLALYVIIGGILWCTNMVVIALAYRKLKTGQIV